MFICLVVVSLSLLIDKGVLFIVLYDGIYGFVFVEIFFIFGGLYDVFGIWGFL